MGREKRKNPQSHFGYREKRGEKGEEGFRSFGIREGDGLSLFIFGNEK